MVLMMIPSVFCFQTFRKGSDIRCGDFSLNKFCFSLCSHLSNFFFIILYVGGGDILDEEKNESGKSANWEVWFFF